MKRFLLSLITIMGVLTVGAQNNISVASFRLDPTDMTANTHGTSVIDQNGEVCALIKVRTTQTGFSFDVGTLGIVKTEQHTAEIWVYVPHGVRHITIQHQQLGTCEYQIPVPVDKARTYIMELTTGEVQTVVKNAVTSQFVVFQVTPKDNAIIQINDENLDVEDGTAMKYLHFGTYDYRISMKGYHEEVGKITVNDPKNKQIVSVRMRPAFGWIDIKENETNTGAKVYVDNELIGTIPCRSDKISSGQHDVRIVKSLYGNWEQQITVNDSLTSVMTPELSANFANVTLTTGEHAEIWVNGENKGIGSWSGTLTAGDYLFETKSPNHRTATINRRIEMSSEPVIIQLPAPTPITGKIEVTTLPAMSAVWIDGVNKGQTPIILDSVLIGEHKVTVSKDGYGDLSETVSVSEGNTASVSGTLSKSINVSIITNNPDATISIDNVDKGRVASSYSLSFGQHRIKITSPDYQELDTVINVSAQQASFTLNQKTTYNQQALSVIYNVLKKGGADVGTIQEFCEHFFKKKENSQKVWKAMYDVKCISETYDEFIKELSNNNVVPYNLLGQCYLSIGETKVAANYFKQAAEQGDARAQNNLGFMYVNGHGVTQNYSEAVKLFREAAEKGYAYAQYNLGLMYDNGQGVAQSYTEAVKWYRKAAEQGDARAQNNLGDMYDNGQGVPQDYTEAAKWYRKAAEQGDAEAQNNLGNMYVNGHGVTQNYSEAVKLFREAAEQGVASAQYNLGVCYDNGYGVTQSYTEAAKWYRKAAEQGLTDAQNNLGNMYRIGQGVTQNYSEAVKWFREAAEQGYANAQYNLGVMYYNGEGVTQSYTEAAKWYRKAAEQGDAKAQCGLGFAYGLGQGVNQSETEAHNWFRKAAELGYSIGQYMVALGYYTGEGVPQNYYEAVKWLNKAISSDNPPKNAYELLAECYRYGRGVDVDYNKADWCQKKAAELDE